MSQEILHSLEKGMQKGMPKLMSNNEFKLFIGDYLNYINSLDGSDPSILNELPSKIKNLLESLELMINSEKFISGNIKNEYSAKLNEIKNITDQQLQFKQIQQLLASMLSNADLKEKIENGLWEPYFERQKKSGPLLSKTNQESASNYTYQVQAEPLKRAFYMLFTAFFEDYAHKIYLDSGGKEQLNPNVDTSNEQTNEPINGYAKQMMHLRGVPFPGPGG